VKHGYEYVILDNWPHGSYPPATPALMQELGIIPVWTPTYTPEANPIEQLWGQWRQLCQDVLDHHRYSADWQGLKPRMIGWLDQFSAGRGADPSPWLKSIKHEAIATKPDNEQGN
jgi:hypothetical protein